MVEEGEYLSIRNVPWIIEGRPSRIELCELRGEGEVLRKDGRNCEEEK
jgi:hypothetical protein